MSRISVKGSDQNAVVDEIEFGCDGDYLSNDVYAIQVNDTEFCRNCFVYKKDVDNMIRALQKAKELWCEGITQNG